MPDNDGLNIYFTTKIVLITLFYFIFLVYNDITKVVTGFLGIDN